MHYPHLFDIPNHRRHTKVHNDLEVRYFEQLVHVFKRDTLGLRQGQLGNQYWVSGKGAEGELSA